MNAGKLNRPISIEAPSQTKDAYGQPSQDWTTLADTWAQFATLTSKEVYALSGSGFTAQVSHKITTRFNPMLSITAGMRVVHRHRIFIVQAVSDPDEARRELNIFALEQSK